MSRVVSVRLSTLLLLIGGLALLASPSAAQERLPENPRELRAVMLDIVFSGINAVGAEIGPQSAFSVVDAINRAADQVGADGMDPEQVRLAIRNTRYFTAGLIRAGQLTDGRVSLGESTVGDVLNALGFCPLYPWC